jgi:hypothetical protein
MTDDLVKRLREGRWHGGERTALEAADRIEELESMQECACAYDHPNDICAFHRRLFERVTTARHDHIERLEAALREIACECLTECPERSFCANREARYALSGEKKE